MKPKDLEAILQLTSDPIKLRNLLWPGSRLWEKQEEIINALWNDKRVVVKSCNSGGKSRVAAEIVILYLLCFPPARVISTAPTFNQVANVLWKEIHALLHSSKYKIGGELTQTALNLGEIDGKPWDAFGITTNEENRFQGYKSPHLLVIMDEALGIKPEIWRSIKGLNPHRILAIGNPLDPIGDFFNCFNNDNWTKITVNGLYALEWQKKHGRVPGLIDEAMIHEFESDYGAGSSEYAARVLGEFPLDSEDSLIKRSWIEHCRQNKSCIEDNEEDETRIIAADVATKHGKNETVIGERYGHTIKWARAWKQVSTPQKAEILKDRYVDFNPFTIVLDSDGYGEGLADVMIETMNLPVTEFHGGSGQEALDKKHFSNLRTQFYIVVAKKFEKGLYDLSKLDDNIYEKLKNQLLQIHTKPHDRLGRFRVETKEDMLSRGIQSPDCADMFMMLEWGFWLRNYADVEPIAYRR